VGVLAVSWSVGVLVGWTPIANRIDNYTYDLMDSYTRGFGNPSLQVPTESVIVGIDEETLRAKGGMRNIRPILAEVLDQINTASPRVVALDVILADDVDPVEDARLEASLRATRNLVLGSQIAEGKWEDPASRFKPLALALGHVHTERDHADGVSRQIELARVAGGQRRWALALEAFRLARGAEIVESPGDLQIGSTVILPAQQGPEYPMLIRYLPPRWIPTISPLQIVQQRDLIRDKTVFLGITALSAAHDRLVSPSGNDVSGVEVHAQAFETMAKGHFLTRTAQSSVLLVCLTLAVAAGLVFGFLSGWYAYVAAAILLGLTMWMPVQFFRHDSVFPYFAPLAVAWLSSAGAASYQHFVVRRQLRKSESEKSRYQQAIHWAAHEMRTPLTAIQGSSELMTRYNLPDAKRGELTEMINSESKRLARIISTFLDVERLADGQMELRQEPLAVAELVNTCMGRARPLAERKHIAMSLDSAVDATLLGDRELLEYALYNLLTNAVKYSPADTEIHVYSALRDGDLRLSVVDQGIGMDAKEIKSIFQKFYRTKRAEASGETGTGIGLSIVEQIVFRHGGRIEVTSTPGEGSCFTMIMKAHASAPTNAETADRRR
jgi:signal transduction histidine kinase